MVEGLTEDERTCIRWAARLNRKAVGFLGPSVRRHGPMGVYDRLVREGLVHCIDADQYRRTMDGYGYWLTGAGWKVARALFAPADRP